MTTELCDQNCHTCKLVFFYYFRLIWKNASNASIVVSTKIDNTAFYLLFLQNMLSIKKGPLVKFETRYTEMKVAPQGKYRLTPYLATNCTRFELWKKHLWINSSERWHISSKIGNSSLNIWTKSLWAVLGIFHTRLRPVRQAVQNWLMLLSCRHHNLQPKILLQ